MFAGTAGGGVYRSTNNGNSFQAVNNGFGATANINAFTSSGNFLYTGLTGNGGSVGVYVSSNEGDLWTQVINGLPQSPSTRYLRAKGTDVYAAVSDKGIFKTTNNGASWFSVNIGLPIIGNGGVTVVETNGGIIYAGMSAGFGAYKSTDDGQSWIDANAGMPSRPTAYSILVRNDYVLYGSQYAVYKSTNNGSSWFASYKGIANTVVNAVIANGNKIYTATMPGNAGNGEGVSVTQDNGENWSASNGGFVGNVITTIAFNGTTMFAGSISRIYKSTNFGANWKVVDSTDLGAGVEKIIVFNDIIFAATYGRGIKKSTDNGTTWQFSNNGLGNNVIVEDLFVDGNSIYAGIFWGVYVSTNNGANWINKSNGIYPGSTVYSLGKSGNNLLAGSYGGLYLSSNNGSSWNLIPSAAPLNSRIHGFALSGSYVYAAEDSGVYRSSDNGFTWTKFSEGLSSYINAISIISFGNNIYIGTNGRGVWKYSLSENLTLNLKTLIQGFYDPLTNEMISDTLGIYLRNVSPPYSFVDSARAVLDVNRDGIFTFANAANLTPYYIIIKHRNGLETWSISGNTFTSGNLSYDFTLSASAAYGNNQILEGTKYCIYNGDVNQDDVIDLTDLGLIDNDVFNFNSGYVAADVNGDGLVDISDLEIADNNVLNFIGIQRP
ncbi:MAG: hypothetical protein M3R36_11865 [Bacteroidota bacterium]|nr:hypothetical protein [Bacteroidota bacterium]